VTSGSPNTSEVLSSSNPWLAQQELFVASLQRQPLLLVIRPEPDDLSPSGSDSALLKQVQDLYAAGLRHLEVAWLHQPGWMPFMQRLQHDCPGLNLGAASVTVSKALNDLSRLDLSYAMAPCWCPELVEQAKGLGVLLVPGVFSPTEVYQAIQFGCRVVKLFPAVNLGPGYWGRLRAPLGPLPFVIAAGGLEVSDLPAWLEAGHGAVALGRRVVGSPPAFQALLDWLRQSTSQR
jgi:2-dehydro-3-deoxyphosphogluconate aldolase/(4S)-4-hydroxy-2-oxoglutarate aldolase